MGGYARIGDTCLVGDGTHSKIERHDSGVLYLTSRNFNDGSLDLSKVYYISESDYAKHFLSESKALTRPQADDLVFSIIGTIGEPYLVRRTDNFGISSSVAIVRPKREFIDPTFLLHWFKGPVFQSALFGIKGGVAQGYVSLEMIRSLPVPKLSLSVQRRIAGILSAYDELMENSQRRIRILEAMARVLYREWFVHFRFPGYGKLTRVASSLGDIPKDWEATKLGTQLSALESGKRPKGGIRDVEDGVPSIGAENINSIGRHDFAGEKFVPREFFQEMRKGVVRNRDVAIYKDGAYIGKSSYFRDGFPHTECCVNEHVFLLRANGVRVKQNALYLWLQEPDTVHAIRATNANAAQPGINQQSVGGLELVVPDEKTAAHFDRLAEPFLAKIINLAKQIQNLCQTRDLLLPRLLSGELKPHSV